VLDSKFDFRLKDASRTLLTFESSPQARTFYLLLLWYGDAGLQQSLFEEALCRLSQLDKSEYLCSETGVFEMDKFQKNLYDENSEVSKLIYNTILIYSAISTKDTENAKFLDYVTKIFHYRSALKHYVNKGFADVAKLSDLSVFSIMFDAQMKVYRLPVKVSRFVTETSDGDLQCLSDHALWESLV
jgi:hypothetical protein